VYKRLIRRKAPSSIGTPPHAAPLERKSLEFDFVTWDTKRGPYFSLINVGRPFNDDLLVTFVDTGDRLVSARFHDAAAVSWQVVGQYGDVERNDRCYEIIGSRWLAEQQDEWGMPELRHLKLNFNLAGVLEVVCTAVTTVSRRPFVSYQDDRLASHDPLDVLQRSLTVLEDLVERHWATPPV